MKLEYLTKSYKISRDFQVILDVHIQLEGEGGRDDIFLSYHYIYRKVTLF